MAKLSRSKQPEFDPRELEDLIFTPAVGTGVGSHLLKPHAPEPPAEAIPSKPPVQLQTNGAAPVVALSMPTVDRFASMPVREIEENQPQTSSVTVDSFEGTTVGPIRSTAIQRTAKTRELWVTESGEFVPGSRVRRIRLAQDVLNAAEESVYDALWNGKGNVRSETDAYRIVQAGYDQLMKRTRLSKKTIQRIVDRLLEKDFIAIEQPADIYHRTSTTYRVFSYRTVLDRHAARGRFYAVKIGPGFLFARQADLTTVVGLNTSTEVVATTPTMVKTNPTTVVPLTTQKIEQDSLDISSSEVRCLKRLLERDLGVIDDDAVKKLIAECRSRAGDCTVQEIAFFVGQKIRAVRNIHNPTGFMLTAIPHHFEGGGHMAVRELLRKQAEHRAQEWREAYAFWRNIASAPGSSAEDRAQAQSVLRDLEGSPDRPGT